MLASCFAGIVAARAVRSWKQAWDLSCCVLETVEILLSRPLGGYALQREDGLLSVILLSCVQEPGFVLRACEIFPVRLSLVFKQDRKPSCEQYLVLPLGLLGILRQQEGQGSSNFTDRA